MEKLRRQNTEINASSMADIAFLLLIFFLVTTTIASEKGLPQLLPPKREDVNVPMPANDRNILRILVNSRNQLLVEDETLDVKKLREKVKEFIENPFKSDKLSDSPQEAIVSIKTDRATKYATFIAVLNEIKGAYHELRAKELGISLEKYLDFDETKVKKAEVARYEEVKKKYPMRISEAEPSKAIE